MQTGVAAGSGLGALVYAALYAVLPEAIAWRALFAAPTSNRVFALTPGSLAWAPNL